MGVGSRTLRSSSRSGVPHPPLYPPHLMLLLPASALLLASEAATAAAAMDNGERWIPVRLSGFPPRLALCGVCGATL